MIPVLTLIGPMAANILTGSALIEQIFSIPGIGQQFVPLFQQRLSCHYGNHYCLCRYAYGSYPIDRYHY